MAGVVSKLSYDSERGSKSRGRISLNFWMKIYRPKEYLFEKFNFDRDKTIRFTEEVISESSEMGGSATISVCRDLTSVALDAFKGKSLGTDMKYLEICWHQKFLRSFFFAHPKYFTTVFTGSVIDESLSDKVLTRCEVLKRAVHDILDAYNNTDKSIRGIISLSYFEKIFL